jgi:DNA (cytosine-5)-methyltransferase 1
MGHEKPTFTFIDLFAGIGGFHTAMHSVGGKCVFASEWDKNARITYEENYKNIEPSLFQKDSEGNYKFFNADINDVIMENIPNFDVLCGGFPCQAFFIAGKRKGFEDTRGTLFFNIAAIVNYKIQQGNKPKILFLENVKGLKNHDHGHTFETLLRVLKEDLQYEVKTCVLNAKYFGVPQNRERLFFVCWDKKQCFSDDFKFPLGLDKNLKSIFEKDLLQNAIPTKVSDILEPDYSIPDKMTISDRMWIGHQLRKERNRANGKGFGYSLFKEDATYCSTISARYWKDGSEILIDQSQKGKNPRKLTPVEAGRLQGYKIIGNGWKITAAADNQNNKNKLPTMKIVVSDKEAYHQFGNSVAVPVIRTLAKEIKKQLLEE